MSCTLLLRLHRNTPKSLHPNCYGTVGPAVELSSVLLPVTCTGAAGIWGFRWGPGVLGRTRVVAVQLPGV
jgi:hypothetical protein